MIAIFSNDSVCEFCYWPLGFESLISKALLTNSTVHLVIAFALVFINLRILLGSIN
jgi:hypothetical protein